MGLNNRTTTGFTSSTPNIVPVQLTVFTHSYTVFIGGASDKYSFAPGDLPINISNQSLGPTLLVGEYVRYFKLEKISKFKECTIRYYGYEEAFTGMTDSKRKNKLNAYKDIVEFINKHPNTQVNIIGHSLGGWNAAGLAEELSKNRICKVNLLITVDPVGVHLSYSALTPIRCISSDLIGHSS